MDVSLAASLTWGDRSSARRDTPLRLGHARTMSEPAQLIELVGVYHANGSLRGELAYVVGKLLGRTHCALCDITHGTVRRKPGFDRCAASLPVPLTLVHLDERDADVAAASDGHTPCIVGRFDDGTARIVVDTEALEACGGDPEALLQLLSPRR